MAIYKRPGSKYYWYKFTFDGQLVQRSSGCTNKIDARTVESAYRTQLALGKVGIEPKKDIPTFEKAADDFLNWIKFQRATTPGTIARYTFSFRVLKSFFGKMKVDRIDAARIEKFIEWRSRQKSHKTKEGISRTTINYELAVLKMTFKRLFDAKILRDNPAVRIKQLPADDKTFHVLSMEEERAYLLAAPQPLQDVAVMILETGMRCGEVYRIKRSEVFLDQNYLQVAKGKTKSAARRVYLSEKAKEILASRIKRFAGENLFPQKDKDGSEPLKTLAIQHLRTMRKLKYNFRLYDCRHTFATRAVESGVDLLTLASMLGHANLKMITIYAHPSESRKAEAMLMMQQTKTQNSGKKPETGRKIKGRAKAV